MKRIIAFVAVGVSLFIAQTFQSSAQEGADKKTDVTADWVDVKPGDGSFQIKLPGKPKEQNQTIPTAVGPVKIQMWIYEKADPNNDLAIVVSYNDYPAEQTAQANPKDVLLGAQNGALGSLQNSKITEQKEIKFQGRPGREFKFEGTLQGRDGYAAWTIVLDENRLYQVGIIDLKRPIDEKTRKAMIESFKLSKNAQ